MDKINQLEKELVDFLRGFIPVKWTEIMFYAESDGSVWSYFYAFREEETNIVVTIDSFYKRYDRYNFEKREFRHILFDYEKKLYYSVAEFSEGKTWNEMICTINKNGEYHFKYVYPKSDKHKYMTKHELLEKYLGSEYYFVLGKYPSTEYILYPGAPNNKIESIIDDKDFEGVFRNE